MPQGLALVAAIREQMRREPWLREVGAQQVLGRVFAVHGCPPHSDREWAAWLECADKAVFLERPEVRARHEEMLRKCREGRLVPRVVVPDVDFDLDR